MKKIILSLSIIFGVAAIAAGATISYFSDSETSNGNSFSTGTVDIDVDEGNPWTGKYEFANLEPGTSRDINFTIHNVGGYPVNVWKKISDLAITTGLQSEPECIAENGTWDESAKECSGMTAEDNEIDKMTDYSLRVELYRNCAGIKIWDQTIYNGNYTVNQIKETDMILGMIPKGDCLKVYQNYKFKLAAGNKYQGDKMTFDIKVIAEQLKGTVVLENKTTSGDWLIKRDSTYAILNYTPKAPEFGYNLVAEGLGVNKKYGLVYHPQSGSDCRLIGEASSDSSGNLNMSGLKELNINLPSNSDSLYPDGAKIWMVPEGTYNTTTGCITGWGSMSSFLYETGLIQYEHTTSGSTSIPDDPTMPEAPDTDDPTPPTGNQAIALNELGDDVSNQYGYNIDYSQADVNFTYNTPASGKLSGTITASGLKPYATYQVKFIGKPICAGSGGNDLANEYVGYKGRWTCVSGATCTGDALARNRTDAQYEANKISGTECIAGYLVWDYFTADASGNVAKVVEADNSYHVLFANGGLCNSTDNSHLAYLDSANPTVKFCPAGDVGGQTEPGRLSCGAMTLNPGVYDLQMALTEESFHQGSWATVLKKDINFTIN
jgi:predicted ribosomally synthesized peptide with SipW-like signal peptide